MTDPEGNEFCVCDGGSGGREVRASLIPARRSAAVQVAGGGGLVTTQTKYRPSMNRLTSTDP